MDLSRIEQLAFSGMDFSLESAFVRRLEVVEGSISIEIIAIPGDRPLAVLEFARVRVVGLWFDDDGPLVWPLDLMHFDSREIAETRWKFVLHCSHLELTWESDWPAKIIPGIDDWDLSGLENGQQPRRAPH